MLTPSEGVVDALAKAHRHLETHPPRKHLFPITIAISRQAGSRGAEIAQAVGARLGWPVYDRELLEHIAQEKGLSARLLEHLDERCSNWLEEIVAGFSTRHNPSEGAYTKHLVQLLASLGKVGHCIIVGRGAGQVLPAETTLNVRVIAPRGLRVDRTRTLKGMSQAEAERWVDQMDADRTRFIENHFNKDPNEPLNYDMVLNSGRHSSTDCAELIVQAARLLKGQPKTIPAVPAS